MGTPRMQGATLRTARWLTEFTWGARIALDLLGKDHGLFDLLSLPSDTRPGMEVEPRPLQGARPRRWSDAGLGAPDAAPGSARSLREAYAARTTDPVAVLEAIVARQEAGDFGPSTHSPFICTDFDRARAAAQASAERYRSGDTRGVLDGIPVPVKDQVDMAGLPTRGGSSYLNDPVEADGYVVGALDAAGAVVPGKTHTTEWGMNPWGMNPHYSVPRNVWRDDRGAGGSSTGSAVAVGLGLSPVAVGSDGGGSIRIPSTLNGLVGVKPSFIRIGRTGDVYGNSSMGHLGPIGRSTEDLVDLLTTIGSTPDPADPLTRLGPMGPEVAQSWIAALGRGVRGCRIGVLSNEIDDAEPWVAAACRAALAGLEAEGAELVEVDIPLARWAHPIGVLNIATETMGALTDDLADHRAEMGDDLQMLLNLFEQLPARTYFMARRNRMALRQQVAEVIAGVDVLALPTVRNVAPPYALSEDQTAINDDIATRDTCRFTFLGNLTGLPAGTVPVGTEDGLPMGLQFVTDAWDEASLFAIMAHCERAGISSRAVGPGWQSLV